MAEEKYQSVRPEIENVPLTSEDYFSGKDEAEQSTSVHERIERSEIISRQPDLSLGVRVLSLALVVSASLIAVAFTSINWIFPAGISLFLFVMLFVGRELELD